MKLKYPNSLPFLFAAVAAVPLLCYYFSLMFGELFFGRPSSTWAIGFVWIPFLVFQPALIGFIIGSLIWGIFRWQKKSGEVPRKISVALFALLILLSFSGVVTGLRQVSEREHYHAPGVSIGKELFDKEQFLTNGKLTDIESITRDNFNGTERLIVIGKTGALHTKLNAEPDAFIPFDKRVGETIPVDIDGNGTLAFMNRGGGWQPVSLLDAHGKTLWLYPSENSLIGGAADSMAAGDLNGDGNLEFVVGMNASGGLHVLDVKGKEIWKKDAGNVFSVEVLDKGPTGTPIILHSDAGKGIMVLNVNGKEINTIKSCGDGPFSFLGQPGTGTPLIVCDNGDLRLVDLNDHATKKLKLPGNGHTPKGTLVYFNGTNNPPFYAFIRTVQATGQRSDFAIFDNNGTLIYHEKFEASYLAISPLTDKDKGVDALLVGENSRVWLYHMRMHN